MTESSEFHSLVIHYFQNFFILFIFWRHISSFHKKCQFSNIFTDVKGIRNDFVHRSITLTFVVVCVTARHNSNQTSVGFYRLGFSQRTPGTAAVTTANYLSPLISEKNFIPSSIVGKVRSVKLEVELFPNQWTVRIRESNSLTFANLQSAAKNEHSKVKFVSPKKVSREGQSCSSAHDKCQPVRGRLSKTAAATQNSVVYPRNCSVFVNFHNSLLSRCELA